MSLPAGATRPLGKSWALALTALCGPASVALLCGLAMCAVLLVARRAASAAQPLAPALLPLTALVLALIAWSSRALSAIAKTSNTSRLSQAAPLTVTSASLLMLGLALGAGGRPWWAALAYWMIVALEEAWAWRSYRLTRHPFRGSPAPNRSRGLSEPRLSPPLAPPAPPVTGHSWNPPHRLTQEYARASLGDGREQIRGNLHLHVPQGARTAIAHVGFCPPFAERPQFEMRLTSGPPCRLKVGQLLPQGARIEIKLHAPPTAPQTLSLEFTADGPEL